MEWLILDKNGSSNLEDVAKVEKQLNVKIPRDFIECSIVNGGGVPLPNAIEINGYKTLIVNRIVSFNENSKYNYIIDNQNIEGLQKGLIAIADDGFGNFWCYDYRESSLEPKIIYWNHDNLLTTYAFKNFTELVDNLFLDEE